MLMVLEKSLRSLAVVWCIGYSKAHCFGSGFRYIIRHRDYIVKALMRLFLVEASAAHRGWTSRLVVAAHVPLLRLHYLPSKAALRFGISPYPECAGVALYALVHAAVAAISARCRQGVPVFKPLTQGSTHPQSHLNGDLSEKSRKKKTAKGSVSGESLFRVWRDAGQAQEL